MPLSQMVAEERKMFSDKLKRKEKVFCFLEKPSFLES
jgi:hypothetical protein